jgi:hypothetical protein
VETSTAHPQTQLKAKEKIFALSFLFMHQRVNLQNMATKFEVVSSNLGVVSKANQKIFTFEKIKNMLFGCYDQTKYKLIFKLDIINLG